MAFDIDDFNNWSSGAANGPRYWAYVSASDTLATILADDYFVTVGNALAADDLIYCVGSDGQGTFTVATASATAVTMGSSSGIATTRTTIAAAAVLLLATTPAELVPAPGAGKILYFEGCHIQLDWGTVAYTEAGDNLVVKYTNAAGVAVSTVIEMTGFITLVADSSTRGLPVLDAIVANTGNENQALVLDNNNANFGNAGDSPLVVDTFYRVINGV
jgi:hypothetical protein